MKDRIKTLDEAIAAFIEGARLYHLGVLLESHKKQTNGLERTDQGVDFIDQHSPNARDILLPLLQSKEDSIRITAASALTASHPKLARAVIEHVHQTCITEAFRSAAGILAFHETFGDYISSLCRPDPCYPKPKEKPVKPDRAELPRLLYLYDSPANDSTASDEKS